MRQLSLKATETRVGEWRPGDTLSDEAYTPEWLVEFVDAVEEIGTDPCWSPLSFVKPRAYGWTVQQDGLAQEWFGHTFINPPYSNPGPFVAEAISRAWPVTLLLPIDPSTVWSKALSQEGRIHNEGHTFPHHRACFYIDIKSRVEFHRPFREKKGEGNRFPSRLYFLRQHYSAIKESLSKNRIGDLQELGGMA